MVVIDNNAYYQSRLVFDNLAAHFDGQAVLTPVI